MSDISIIVDGFGISHDKPLAFYSSAHPRHSIVLNEREKLANAAQALTQVFFRFKGQEGWADDDDLFNDDGFNGYDYAHWLAQGLAKGVGLYGGNEPSYTARLIDNTCDFMQACIDMDRPAYLFNFSVFNPPDRFLQDLKAHARFNALFHLGTFWIGLHSYFDESIAQGIQDGAILRELMFNLQREGYPVADTEWGYLKRYDPHAGWLGRITESHYLQQLKLYTNDLNDKGFNFPVHVFMWNRWHDCEVGEALQFQQAIIDLNRKGEDMHLLVGSRSGMQFHVRTGKGVSFASLGVIDLDTTPVSVLDFDAVNGYYRIHVPSRNITGWMYQSGNTYLGRIGLRKV